MLITKKTLLLTAVSALFLSACGGSSDKNQPPVFSQSSYVLTLAEDSSAQLTLTASDPDGDKLTYSISSQAKNGVVVVDATTGKITYTPNADYHGTDTAIISVSDGQSQSSTTINITVTPVNDAPVFTSTIVQLSGGEVKTGQIQAMDVDGDTLTYRLNSQSANGQLSLDSTTGIITFTLTELVEINETISVTVLDGNGGETTAELTLSNSLVSNSDRAYYYYASAESHLARAEKLLQSINDDVQQDLIYTSLAASYASAALDNQTEKYLAAIINSAQQARAKLQVARAYNLQQRYSDATTLAAAALNQYSEFLAAKGVGAFANEDGAFFAELAGIYEQAQNPAAAADVFAILDLLFSNIMSGEYSTAMMRSYFAMRNLVDDRINNWQATADTEERSTLLQLNARLYRYALLVPAQTVANNRNGNLGKAYYAVKQTALGSVVANYLKLNDYAAARQVLADILALYGVVNYDPAISRNADPYASITKQEFPAGLASHAGDFVTLYPELAFSWISDAIPSDQALALAMAESKYTEAQLMAKIGAASSSEEVLAIAQASKDPAKLREYFTNLVAFNSIYATPKAAIIRINQGDYHSATLLLAEALSVLTSEEYINANLGSQPFVSGHVGCHMLIQSHLLIAERDSTNNATHLDSARTVAQHCVDLAQSYYGDGVEGSDVDISDAVRANSEVIKYLAPLGMQQQIELLLATAETNLAKYTQADLGYKMQDLSAIATYLYQGNLFAEAQTYFDRAIPLVQAQELAAADQQIGLVSTRFFYQRGSTHGYNNYLSALQHQAGLLADYPALIASARAKGMALLTATLQQLAQASQQTQLTYIPLIADYMAQLQQYDAALALRAQAVFGEVEQASITTKVATYLALQDDFPATNLASVDTDKDGKPNFFAAFANSDAIAASGLVLDEDSDNDGVPDENDSFPLDPTRH